MNVAISKTSPNSNVASFRVRIPLFGGFQLLHNGALGQVESLRSISMRISDEPMKMQVLFRMHAPARERDVSETFEFIKSEQWRGEPEPYHLCDTLNQFLRQAFENKKIFREPISIDFVTTEEENSYYRMVLPPRSYIQCIPADFWSRYLKFNNNDIVQEFVTDMKTGARLQCGCLYNHLSQKRVIRGNFFFPIEGAPEPRTEDEELPTVTLIIRFARNEMYDLTTTPPVDFNDVEDIVEHFNLMFQKLSRSWNFFQEPMQAKALNETSFEIRSTMVYNDANRVITWQLRNRRQRAYLRLTDEEFAFDLEKPIRVLFTLTISNPDPFLGYYPVMAIVRSTSKHESYIEGIGRCKVLFIMSSTDKFSTSFPYFFKNDNDLFKLEFLDSNMKMLTFNHIYELVLTIKFDEKSVNLKRMKKINDEKDEEYG